MIIHFIRRLCSILLDGVFYPIKNISLLLLRVVLSTDRVLNVDGSFLSVFLIDLLTNIFVLLILELLLAEIDE